MLRKVYLIASTIFLMTACLCFSSSQQVPAPEPPEVALTAPDPSLPAQIKSLVGKWVGQWNSRWGWDTVIYVEKVDKESAQVVLAWGEYNTSKNSCHCGPNWVRVQNAKVKYSDEGVTLDFYTPKLRPGWLKKSHTITGSAEETFRPNNRSTGQYIYSFVVEKDNPDTMKGHFTSAKASQLRIEMKKVEQSRDAGVDSGEVFIRK